MPRLVQVNRVGWNIHCTALHFTQTELLISFYLLYFTHILSAQYSRKQQGEKIDGWVSHLTPHIVLQCECS